MKRRDLLRMSAGLPGLAFIDFPNNQAAIKIRFAVASDGHFGQPGTPFNNYHKDVVQWFNQEKAQKRLDFVVFNGDLIHDEPTLLYDFKNAIKPLTMPFYVTRGNHDKVGLDVWESTWGYPTNHSFSRGEYAFILADTSNEKGEYLCPDLGWLRIELDKYKQKRGIYVFMHITPKAWTDNGVDCPELRKLLAETPIVKAIFHGHDHDMDGVKKEGELPYFFDGHFGGGWGTTYKGYRIVEIYDNGSWKSYQFNPKGEPTLNSFQAKG